MILLVITVMKPTSNFISCIKTFGFYTLLIYLLMIKIRVHTKWAKARKGRQKKKVLVKKIHKMKLRKIITTKGMILTIVILMMVTRSMLNLRRSEPEVTIKHDVKIPTKVIKGDSKNVLKINLVTKIPVRENESNLNKVEHNHDSVEQSNNNKKMHAAEGNKVCKIMQLNKGSSMFDKRAVEVLHEIQKHHPSIVNICEANYPNTYKYY